MCTIFITHVRNCVVRATPMKSTIDMASLKKECNLIQITIAATLFIQIDYSFWFDTINLG